MPFSFVQIERDETRTIQWSFTCLILFYLFSALLLVFVAKYLFVNFYAREGRTWIGPGDILDLVTVGWTLLGVGLGSFFHWNYAVNGLIDKTLGLMSARAADPARDDEKMLMNVVDEAAVACGGRYRIEARILPTSAMNAFAIQDFDGRSVIGVTEGLLKRLNRGQLEAVVAHEAGHIASGDSLSTCVNMSIFKVFDNACDLSGSFLQGFGGRRRDDRLLIIILVLFLLASLLKFIGFIGAMFISRQREYRADAISVKLTRNPLALAEALFIIKNRWKGSGMPGQAMEAIFIMSPRANAVEDEESAFADIFTTHPPIDKRIDILLDMAHADRKALGGVLAQADQKVEVVGSEPLISQQGQQPRPGSAILSQPFNIPGLPLAAVNDVNTPSQKNGCPRCHVPLVDTPYEQVRVQKCGQCCGILTNEKDVLSIVGAREMTFAPAITEIGDLILRQSAPLKRHPYDLVYYENSILCPFCLDASPRMTRRFINQRYPIEIDKCRICGRVWFDKDELEVLQYVYEKEHPTAAK